MPKRARIFKIIIPLIVALLLISLVFGYWIFKRALPVYAGHAEISSLSTPVTIYRDEFGVAHIFGNNMNDAARALGYVHASERFFQMEMQRRAGEGRLSEVIGSSMLPVDKFLRTLQLYALSETSAESLSPEAKAYFQAYADGVNAWLDTHQGALPPEFFLLHIHPDHWVIADSLVWGKLMGLQLSHNYKLEVLRATLAKTLSPTALKELFSSASGSTPITIAPHTLQKTENQKNETEDAFDQLGVFTSLGHGASNEWVISGKRTDTGKPILANDPHLTLEAPILWYLARIVTPELSLKGATVPGLPTFVLGQNDQIAWGFTTTGSDVEDLFIETIDPNNADQYLTPAGPKAFDQHQEVIHVKAGRDVTFLIRKTRHGPVLSDIDDDMAALAGKGRVMALAFTGLGDHDETAEALMRLNRAKNWSDFLGALKLYQTPPQNAVYADRAGNIGFVNPGLVPVRKSGGGLFPVDGASGQFDWIGMIPFTQLPQLYNPPAGFVFNANNAVIGPGAFYNLGVDWEEPFRAERLQQLFDAIPKHSLETSAAMQADHVSLAARELLPYLLSIKPSSDKASEALDLLKVWDGGMDKDRPEPLLFEAWLYQMHRLMLEEKTGNPLSEKGPFAATTIASILANHETGWCGETYDKPSANCDALIGQALDEALKMLSARESGSMKSWRWGHENKTLLKNKVFGHIPFLSHVSNLSIESSGDFYTIDRGGGFSRDPDYPFARTHGGGFRGLYDLDDPSRSRFMITTGQSGHIFSSHYSDLLPLWNDVKSFTLTGTEEELAARGFPALVLNP